jgi:oxygen-independent coproporphyrinogen-3 oxidase
MEASLYIHIPFCAGLCGYCDFYSVQAYPDDPRFDRYMSRVLSDTARAFTEFGVSSVPSVYIGGGTPSLLGKNRLERLFFGLNALLPQGETREFTVEANPESVDEAFFTVCRTARVTRVSLGVQTFFTPSRKAVHRMGGNLMESLELARAFYPQSFSVDLIAGLPLQTEAVLRADIEKVLSFTPAHISLYALTLEENSPLFRKLEGKNEDRISGLWLLGRDFLEENSYISYEISNFCLNQDKISAHNMRYWRMENWIGVGAGASGTVIDDKTGTGVRLTVYADVDKYLNAPSGFFKKNKKNKKIEKIEKKEALDKSTLIKETFLMGFRTIFGPDENLFQKRFGGRVENYIPRTIAKWRGKGLFAQDRLRLTKEGMLFLNAFLRDAFAEIL